ncbi:MAG: hypothetical protein D3923_07255 [Candidatus Electrothrix sp. AR3]|nr:hypothetical protein [Candidatus Electrothrix sp. AR3]
MAVKEKGLPVEYRSDLEDFLGKTMLFLNDQAGRKFCSSFPALFDEAMTACVNILGKGCFRVPKKGKRRPISMALFEAAGYLIIELIDLPEKNERINNAFKELLRDDEFIRSTTYIVDSNVSINKRFKLVENIIEEIRNA